MMYCVRRKRLMCCMFKVANVKSAARDHVISSFNVRWSCDASAIALVSFNGVYITTLLGHKLYGNFYFWNKKWTPVFEIHFFITLIRTFVTNKNVCFARWNLVSNLNKNIRNHVWNYVCFDGIVSNLNKNIRNVFAPVGRDGGDLFQTLIRTFVTLNIPYNYYVADFNTLTEITQIYIPQTHKTLQTL